MYSSGSDPHVPRRRSMTPARKSPERAGLVPLGFQLSSSITQIEGYVARSHESMDTPLPEAVASGAEPLLIIGAIAGGCEQRT